MAHSHHFIQLFLRDCLCVGRGWGIVSSIATFLRFSVVRGSYGVMGVGAVLLVFVADVVVDVLGVATQLQLLGLGLL